MDDLRDTLRVLVTIHILWHLFPFLFHVRVHLLLVFNVHHSLLQLFLQFFDFIAFVLVFNAFVTDLLFSFENFFFDRLLILFPLITQVRQFIVHR